MGYPIRNRRDRVDQCGSPETKFSPDHRRPAITIRRRGDRIVRKYVDDTGRCARDRLLRDPPESEEQKADMQAEAEIGSASV